MWKTEASKQQTRIRAGPILRRPTVSESPCPAPVSSEFGPGFAARQTSTSLCPDPGTPESGARPASPNKASTPELTSQKLIPPIPYPQRIKKKTDDDSFKRFVQVLKQLHINIPFVEALAKIPSYAKYLKELLSKKRKLDDWSVVPLTEECSAILQNKLPPKLKDPGSFIVPCNFGDVQTYNCLCDLGASVNLMPMSLYRKLGLGELKPTNVTLQLADRTIRYPDGIVENLLVKVGKLIVPIDIYVINMEFDLQVPVIMGRPFLATSGALIDVPAGEITFRIGDEREVFRVFKPLPICSYNTCVPSSSTSLHDVPNRGVG